MNKKISNQLAKIIILIMIFLILATVLFIFTSCKSDYQKAFEGEPGSFASKTITNTTSDTDADAADQAATSEKETTAQSSDNETDAVAETETTSEPADSETQQIIEVVASSGGYSPQKIEAKAGIPTILVMKSEGAYGCERAFNIVDRNAKKILKSKILPENGQTDFDLGTQTKGMELLGVCSMGMYYFQIFFT